MDDGEHQGDAGVGGTGSRQSAGAPAPIVAFDFDGTLTTRDSFTAFLRWRTGGLRWAVGLVRLLPAALAYVATRDRGRLKGEAIAVFLQGVARETLARDAQAFAECEGRKLLRPDALAAWAAHGTGGVIRVIVTASPEEIVAPFARQLGADVLIGSRLLWTGQGRVGRGLAGANCRGAEKVRRLRERFGSTLQVCDAYGDTAGDREMLAMAQRGHMRRFTARPAGRAVPSHTARVSRRPR